MDVVTAPAKDKKCFNCIKNREGYAEEFLEKIGITIEAWDKSK